jgi:hypothetical protein
MLIAVMDSPAGFIYGISSFMIRLIELLLKIGCEYMTLIYHG